MKEKTWVITNDLGFMQNNSCKEVCIFPPESWNYVNVVEALDCIELISCECPLFGLKLFPFDQHPPAVTSSWIF